MCRRLSALVLVVLGFTVGGCTVGKDGHTYVDGNCVTCLNNPLTGEAMNYEKTSPDYVAGKNYAAEQRRIRLAQGGQVNSAQEEGEHKEGMVMFSVGKPVDIAYIRIKKEFKLRTRKEVEATFSRAALYMVKEGENFTYEALPGVSYHLRDVVEEPIGNVRYDARLETNGAGTTIAFTYWVLLPKSQVAAFGNSLKQRALRALR